MDKKEKIQKAIDILKASGAKGKFRAYLSEKNNNEVEIVGEAGPYCIINVTSRKIKEF